MTYSILARDPDTGEMGVAAQSQAFAIGSSVTWALPRYGAIATQSVGEPAYGELGLDAMRAGLSASEALTALKSVDPQGYGRGVSVQDVFGTYLAEVAEVAVSKNGEVRVERVVCAVIVNPDTVKAQIEGGILVEAHGHCGECHTPRNLFQGLDAGEKFAGAITGGWQAYNITSDRRVGIGAWSDDVLANIPVKWTRRGARFGVRADGRSTERKPAFPDAGRYPGDGRLPENHSGRPRRRGRRRHGGGGAACQAREDARRRMRNRALLELIDAGLRATLTVVRQRVASVRLRLRRGTAFALIER